MDPTTPHHLCQEDSCIVVASVQFPRLVLQVQIAARHRIGLSRLCSVTFEQLFAVLASNLEQILPFGATLRQNLGLEHIASTKKSTIS